MMSPALYVVIVAMLFQQAMSYMAAQVLPAVAKQAGDALLLNPELVFYHTTLFYAVSGVFQASVGGLIIRWGSIRASQLSLLGLGLGLGLSMLGTIWAFAVAAIIMGAANSFSTPASSHLLARHCPPKYAPLIFSIKQTGVPLGGLIAAFATRLLVDQNQPESWTQAFLATSIICLVLMAMIHPMRRRFDADRNPGYPVRFTDAIRNIGLVRRTPALRDLAFGMFAFVGLQGLFNSIFATYAQTTLGYDQPTAIDVLIAVNLVAALARIYWGWIGSSWAPARDVLAALGFIMTAATIAVGQAVGWPLWLLAFAALVFGISALSWHGLLLSEVARLAPPGQVGPVTGGVLFWGALGMLSYPFVAKTLRDLGVGYDTIFMLASIPALLMGVKLLWPAKAAPAADIPAAAATMPPAPPSPPPPAPPPAPAFPTEPLEGRRQRLHPSPFAPTAAVLREGLGLALRQRRRRG